MKEHPVLFSTPMVQANLDNRKGMTRRTTGLDNINNDPDRFEFVRIQHYCDCCKAVFRNLSTGSTHIIRCRYGEPGDLLWVRETGFDARPFKSAPLFKDGPNFYYKADNSFIGDHKWSPSIHMSKDVARIWLQVEEIRVERLKDISEEDAIAEGIENYGPFGEYKGSPNPNGGMMRFRAYERAARAFQDLWEEINGQLSWDANPWVWVVKYKVLSTTGKPKTEPG